MKIIKNILPEFIPTILIIILILIFSSCSSVNVKNTYGIHNKPYTTTYYGNVEVKDMMLLLDRCNLTYTNYDNYVNTKLIGSIINEESPTKSHNVAYTCIINYKVEKNKVVVNVYDLKVKRIKGKTTKLDFDFCVLHIKTILNKLNFTLIKQINY